MEEVVQEIKQKVDIVQFIGLYVQLKRAGRNFKGLCPFHNEKSPSFMVSSERQLWRCFGACGDGGDVITFVMKFENITFSEAIKDLAERYGIEMKHSEYEDQQWKQKDHIFKMNLLARDYYHYILTHLPVAKAGRDYLESRGTNEKITKTFQLGYAPQSWDSLIQFFHKKNITSEDLVLTGLVIKNEKGHYYDRFRGRLMFPIHDARGNVIGFSGRTLDPTTKEAKYVNTPETFLYHKRESLFGIHLAKDAIRTLDQAILVEGEFDMITPYQYGIENIVAIKGAAVTKEQITLLKRYTNRITLLLDGDTAGEEAMKRGIEVAEEQDCEMNIVRIENAKDPDEAVRTDLIAFKKALKHPLPIYDFLIDLARKKYSDQDPFGKKKIADDVMPVILRIKNPILQSHYIKKLATILEVSEESISAQMKKVRGKEYSNRKFKKITPEHTKSVDRFIMLEKFLVATLLQHEKPHTISSVIFSVLVADDYSIPSYGMIMKAFDEYLKSHSPETFSYDEFLKSLPVHLHSVSDELFLFDTSQGEAEDIAIERVVYELKRYALKRKISALLSDTMEDTSSPGSITSATTMLNEVEKKLASL